MALVLYCPDCGQEWENGFTPGDPCPEEDCPSNFPDELEICNQCNGSGEGMYDGTTCGKCGGSGEIDYRETDEDAKAEYEAERFRQMMEERM